MPVDVSNPYISWSQLPELRLSMADTNRVTLSPVDNDTGTGTLPSLHHRLDVIGNRLHESIRTEMQAMERRLLEAIKESSKANATTSADDNATETTRSTLQDIAGNVRALTAEHNRTADRIGLIETALEQTMMANQTRNGEHLRMMKRAIDDGVESTSRTVRECMPRARTSLGRSYSHICSMPSINDTTEHARNGERDHAPPTFHNQCR